MHGRGLAAGGPRRPRVGSVPIGLRTEVLRVSLNQLIQRGISAWEREDYETALATFREVLDENPGFADIQNKAGLCMAMLGDVEGALGAFDAALALNPGFAEAHLNRGIMLNELGDHDAGQEAFAKAGELDTRDGTAFPSDVGNQIAVTHAKLGDLYLVANHPAEAAQQYHAAIRVRPRFLDVRSKLAEALLEVGDADGARSERARAHPREESRFHGSAHPARRGVPSSGRHGGGGGRMAASRRRRPRRHAPPRLSGIGRRDPRKSSVLIHRAGTVWRILRYP